MSLPLYELAPQYEALAELPLEEAADGGLEQALGAIRDEARDKALSLAKVVKSIEAEVELLEEHTRLLQAKAQARRERADYLRRRIKLELEAAGVDKVKDAFVTAWLQQSPPSVVVVDEALIPPEYLKAVLRLPLSLVPENLRGLIQHLDVDRAALLELMKRDGHPGEGVAIKVGERHLRIR